MLDGGRIVELVVLEGDQGPASKSSRRGTPKVKFIFSIAEYRKTAKLHNNEIDITKLYTIKSTTKYTKIHKIHKKEAKNNIINLVY